MYCAVAFATDIQIHSLELAVMRCIIVMTRETAANLVIGTTIARRPRHTTEFHGTKFRRPIRFKPRVEPQSCRC